MRKMKSVNLTMCQCLKRAYSALSLFIQMSWCFIVAVRWFLACLCCGATLAFFPLQGSFLKLVINIFGGRILQSNPIHYLPFYKRLRNLIHCSTELFDSWASQTTYKMFFFFTHFPWVSHSYTLYGWTKIGPFSRQELLYGCCIVCLYLYTHTKTDCVPVIL